jgi:hypothetical protein
MFVDEKDSSSKLILSHIYLLVGFSFPVWASNFDGNILKFKLTYLFFLQIKNLKISFIRGNNKIKRNFRLTRKLVNSLLIQLTIMDSKLLNKITEKRPKYKFDMFSTYF